MHINEDGGAVSSVPSGAAAGTAKIEPPTQDEVDTAAAEVGRILSAADEIDRIAARALRKHAAGKYNFSEAGYKGLEDADRKQGIEDADAMLKLAAKADGMTDAQLKHFNEVAKYQRDNPAFAERFATKLGPEGTLQFWRSLADPGHGDAPTGDRAKILSTVQDNLGLTLATASRVDSPAMQEWKDGVIAAGDDRIKHPGGSGDLVDRDGLFGKDTHRLRDFGETGSMQFMRALGADEDSHATLSVAQQVYGSSLMTAQGDDSDSAVAAGLHSVKMHGMLDESRIEAIGKEFGDDKTERTEYIARRPQKVDRDSAENCPWSSTCPTPPRAAMRPSPSLLDDQVERGAGNE
ncbi:hypothetical protein ABT115_16075 [Streptomyces sp. NPDC001832]|uniref:hypothetical protein n=1 Tax=Streptomyces sp. NPDC001832 TaxID=3154527 RepID=UPI003334624C